MGIKPASEEMKMDDEMRALELRNGSRDYMRMSQRSDLSSAEKRWARARAKDALREAEEIERVRDAGREALK